MRYLIEPKKTDSGGYYHCWMFENALQLPTNRGEGFYVRKEVVRDGWFSEQSFHSKHTYESPGPNVWYRFRINPIVVEKELNQSGTVQFVMIHGCCVTEIGQQSHSKL